jgi:hypothetical protein
MEPTSHSLLHARDHLSRVIDALEERGARHVSFSCLMNDPAWAGEAQADLTHDDLPGGTHSRQTLCLSTRMPGSLPSPVATLTRVVFSEAGGRLRWSQPAELELALGADPHFAASLCKASADKLAPQNPSLLARLLGRRGEPKAPAEPTPKTPNFAR